MLRVREIFILLIGVLVLSCTSDEKIVVGGGGNGKTGTGGGSGGTITADVMVAKKVLIEDYLATWCGNCILAIERSEQADRNVFVPVAIHFLGSAIQNPAAVRVASENRVSSQTTVIVDKHTTHNFRNTFDASDYETESVVAIALDSELEGGDLDVRIRFKFYTDLTGLRYSVYLTKNGIVASQRNYQFSGSIYQNSPSTISDFVHNHVLQDAILNQSIVDSEAVEDAVVEKMHSFDVSPTSLSDLEVIVYIESSSRVFNTQKVVAGRSIDFHAELE